MEELREKAKNYAEENVINVLKEALAKVYADGYRDGYKDREDEIPVDTRTSQTKFIDLGLPSGTLWSTDYEKAEGDTLFLPYSKTEGKHVPTEEQWKELLENCKWQGDYSSTGVTFYSISCIGPNGNVIRFRSEGYMIDNKHVDHIDYGGGQIYFWLFNDQEDDEHKKKAITIERGTKRTPENEVIKIFSGYRLPVRLIKTK